jgi:molecular chaperone GrpE
MTRNKKTETEKDHSTNMSEEIINEKQNDASSNEILDDETIDSENKEKDKKVLEEDYKKAVNQSQEYFQGWQRERADFLNYKKRIERDQASLKNFISAEIIKKYLAVIDDMELALKNRPQSEDNSEWMNGIDLIYQKLVSILESEGVEKISTEGEFNPNIHEALTQVDSPDHESGQIVEVMRKGYKIGDRVIRPALVVVAR